MTVGRSLPVALVWLAGLFGSQLAPLPAGAAWQPLEPWGAAAASPGCLDATDTASVCFGAVYDVREDGARNVLVADTGSHCIRWIHPDGVTIETWMGRCGMPGLDDGQGVLLLRHPSAVAFDLSTGAVYVADTGNRRIVALDAGLSTPRPIELAGRPDAFCPVDLEFDRGLLYVVDRGSSRVIRFDPEAAAPRIETVAGTGQAGYLWDVYQPDGTPLDQPTDLLVLHTGDAWLVDAGNRRLRRLEADLDDGGPRRFIGLWPYGGCGYRQPPVWEGPVARFPFERPFRVAYLPFDASFVVTDQGLGEVVAIRDQTASRLLPDLAGALAAAIHYSRLTSVLYLSIEAAPGPVWRIERYGRIPDQP